MSPFNSRLHSFMAGFVYISQYYPVKNSKLQLFAQELTQRLTRLIHHVINVTKNVLKGTQHEETIIRAIRALAQKETLADSTAALIIAVDQGAISGPQQQAFRAVESQLQSLADVNRSILEATKQVRSLLVQVEAQSHHAARECS